MGIDTGWLLVAAGFVGAIVMPAPTAGVSNGWLTARCVILTPDCAYFRNRYVHLPAKLRQLTEGSRDVALPSLFNGQWVVAIAKTSLPLLPPCRR